jgi:hypothetical protein
VTTIKSSPEVNHLRMGSSLQIAAAVLGLVWLAGCLPTRSGPAESPAPPPTSLPTSSSQTSAALESSEAETHSGANLTVVGIKALQTLPLYRSPSLDAEINGSLPPGGKFIKPLENDPAQQGQGWLQVEYQGLRGWAEKSHLAVQEGDLPEELVMLGQFVTGSLQAGDYQALAEVIHPQQCLRFAPYQYLRETDQIFCPQELAQIQSSNDILVWGSYDGSGEPIFLTFLQYHDRFVYDADFFQPLVVGFNQAVSQGNSINNIPEIYPDGIMLEYYFPGFDPQYGGMDWRSLRLVFVNDNGQWYLTALVHGEWTI